MKMRIYQKVFYSELNRMTVLIPSFMKINHGAVRRMEASGQPFVLNKTLLHQGG